WRGRIAPRAPSRGRAGDRGHLERLTPLVALDLFGARELLEALLLLQPEDRLADVPGQPGRARVVLRARRLVCGPGDEVGVEVLLPLLHLALEDAPEVRLLADDVGRQDEDEVALLEAVLRPAEERAEDGDVAEDGDLVLLLAEDVPDEPSDHDRLLVL